MLRPRHLLAVLAVATAVAAASDPLKETYQEAKSAYKARRWDDAESALRRLAELLSAPAAEAARPQVLPAYHFYSAAVAWKRKDQDRVREQLVRFFALSPTADVDPAIYPEGFVAFFRKVREAEAPQAPPPGPETIGGGTLPPYATRDVDVAAVPQNTGAADWADGPVGVLLTDSERKTYRRLGDDAARREWAARFWAAVDPTPEDGVNQAQEEFYRRVQYADATFSTEQVKGSVSDRGQVFLVFGPPSYAARAPVWPGQDPMTILRSRQSSIAATPGSVAGEAEIWYYRTDRIPDGVSFQELQFQFITKEGYGTAVLQKEPRVLLALGQAAKAFRKRP